MGDEKMSCYLCHSSRLVPKYSYETGIGNFTLVKCKNCKLWQLTPLPAADDLEKLYQSEYFKKRTDRGYNDYASEAIRMSVQGTLEKNLQDLNFHKHYPPSEKPYSRSMLDIGCAAGHIVEAFQSKGWQAAGIDIAKEMVDSGKKRGLHLIHGDFLKHDFKDKRFDLLTFWATLEHLNDPLAFLRKAARLLKPEGHLYLSTCHTGLFARLYGAKWRYLNVPEHIFYFHRKNLRLLAEQAGLRLNASFTYGSGFTAKPSAGAGFRLLKALADRAAKQAHLGDMIVCDFVPQGEERP